MSNHLDALIETLEGTGEVPATQGKTPLHPVAAIAELLAMQVTAKRIYDQVAVLLTEPQDRKSWDMAMADLRKFAVSCAAKVERLDAR